VVAAVIAVTVVASLARADGDPASDVLLHDDVFFPYGEPVSAGLQARLDAETAAATRASFPIKVALIQSSVDLGAVGSLFGRPQMYADFLDQELGLQTEQRRTLALEASLLLAAVLLAAILSQAAPPTRRERAVARIAAIEPQAAGLIARPRLAA